MSIEFREKLLAMYGGKIEIPTPKRIEDMLVVGNDISQLSVELNYYNCELLKEIFHPNGSFFSHKVPNFTSSLISLREKYSEEDLMYLSAKCVRTDGTINERRFKRILKKNS